MTLPIENLIRTSLDSKREAFESVKFAAMERPLFHDHLKEISDIHSWKCVVYGGLILLNHKAKYKSPIKNGIEEADLREHVTDYITKAGLRYDIK